MKTKLLYAAGLLSVIGFAACNGSSSSGSTNTGDSTVTTTTTTTYHRYSGTFTPQASVRYIDLKTNKEITVRVDTVRGSLVNSETNEPVDLFVAPDSHDTIYGQTGTVVNNYIIHDPNGNMSVDTSRLNTMPTSAAAQPAPADTMVDDGAVADDQTVTGKVRYKQNAKGNKMKYKDADEKIKEKNGTVTEKIKND